MTTITENTTENKAPKKGGKKVTLAVHTDNVPNYKAMVTALAKESSWEDLYNKLTAVNKSKMSRATSIYTDLMAKGKVRKDVITAFKTELEMTDACASTYLQNIRKKLKKSG